VFSFQFTFQTPAGHRWSTSKKSASGFANKLFFFNRSALKNKAERKYPVEYNMAKDRYPVPADY
jgi:hypothetical protein